MAAKTESANGSGTHDPSWMGFCRERRRPAQCRILFAVEAKPLECGSLLPPLQNQLIPELGRWRQQAAALQGALRARILQKVCDIRRPAGRDKERLRHWFLKRCRRDADAPGGSELSHLFFV
jgi:hypothetical protein